VPTIHIINLFQSAAGGSEGRALGLYDLLTPHADVHLWAEKEDACDLAAFPRYPIQIVSEAQGRFPAGGTLLFVGAYFAPGSWIRRCRANRAIVVYNIYRKRLEAIFDALSALNVPVEIVYASTVMARLYRELGGGLGIVQPSPIDLQRFHPAPERKNAAPFCVGRMSRDDARKHHLPDADLYKELVRAGAMVRIMGGTPLLEDALRGTDGIELLPPLAHPADDFLRTLDCFYYRTSSTYVEASARVVMEAMAVALPVVAHRSGGYADWITDGQTGFLFDDQEEAKDLILRLKDSPKVRETVGQAARDAMLKTYGRPALEEMRDFYLSERAVEPPTQ
jgi:glycosyltransferase involved in cell wall biosynthesis